MFSVRRVSGGSMLPTLRPGQIVIAKKPARVAVGDIVVVRHDGLEKIKRVAKMQDGRIFVTGDNPAASTDSRSFGWLRLGDVCGRLIWPK